MFKLAELFVDLKARDAGLKSQLDGVRSQLGAMGVAIGTAVGSLVAGAIVSATSALTGFLSRGISGAVNLGESMSKVNAVFGQSAGALTATADLLADRFGLSKQAILDAGAGIGLVAKAAGQSQAEAAGLGASMAKLAADASSFYNVPLDVALEKIRSGLVGEAEPLRAFGVLLTEEAVAAEAVALGLASTTKEVDQQAKVMARASLITKGLKDATGDLERTADSTANQWRKLTGSVENLAVEIGQALMPAVNSLASLMISAVDTISIIWRNLGDEWAIVQVKATEMAANLMAIFAAIPENLARIGQYLATNWRELIVDSVSAVATAFKNLAANLANLGQAIVAWASNPLQGFEFNWTPLLDGFRASAAQLPELLKPELVSMQGEIDEITRRISDRESARGKAAIDQARAAAKPGQAAADKAAKNEQKESEFRSTAVGVSEFASKLRESIFSSADDTAKAQLETQQKLLKASEETRDALKRGVPALLG